MPVGCLDNLLQPFVAQVLPLAKGRNTGVIGMKAVGHGILDDYAGLAVRYAFGQSVAVTLIGMSTLYQLTENAAAASPFVPLSPEEEESLLAKVGSLATAENMWWRRS